MGWKGTVRSLQTSARRAERNAHRRQRELEKRQKEFDKMEALEQAAYAEDPGIQGLEGAGGGHSTQNAIDARA